MDVFYWAMLLSDHSRGKRLCLAQPPEHMKAFGWEDWQSWDVGNCSESSGCYGLRSCFNRTAERTATMR